MIMCKKEHAAAIDRAVFPGLQGGPHNHATAGIAVAALEALDPSFKAYAKAVVDNAKVLSEELIRRGFAVTTGGTDNHLMVVDVTKKGTTGKIAAKALDRAGIVLNYNAIPFDPRKPFDPSGVRLGTPAVTTRGMGKNEMLQLAEWMDRVVSAPTDESLITKVGGEVRDMCRRFNAAGIRIS
jgi:glycine hydroxymethyltransferase